MKWRGRWEGRRPETKERTYTDRAGVSRERRHSGPLQSHRANFRLQTKTCWPGLLLEWPASPNALGSRSEGAGPQESEGLPEEAGSTRGSPTGTRPAGPPGPCHPTRNKRQLEPGAAAPVPAVLHGGGRVGEPGPGGDGKAVSGGTPPRAAWTGRPGPRRGESREEHTPGRGGVAPN